MLGWGKTLNWIAGGWDDATQPFQEQLSQLPDPHWVSTKGQVSEVTRGS